MLSGTGSIDLSVKMIQNDVLPLFCYLGKCTWTGISGSLMPIGLQLRFPEIVEACPRQKLPINVHERTDAEECQR